VFGNPRQDSDIDVVLYYEGNIKEDALFNILHDDEYKDQFIYDDIEIDVNPIRDEETGSLQKYIEKDKNYKK
jgi:predicted nucleotidyltransferase